MRVTRAVILATLALFLPACAVTPPAGPSGMIEGKAVFHHARVAGAIVSAVSDLGVRGRERHFTAVTDADGAFRLSVPPGTYFVSFARGNDLFGFFGGNPVTVRLGAPSQIVLRGMSWTGPAPPLAGETGVEGRALLDEAGVEGAVVQAFLDASGNFRGPGYAQALTGGDGAFSLDLPAGRYFVVARKRRGPERVGPLEIGDLYAFFPGNPVFLREGERPRLELPFVEVEKEPARALADASRGSTLRGRVVDAAGKPVAGVYACLYLSSEPLGMPAFVSGATGAGGEFAIRVTTPGPYHLVVRGSIGRPLEPGEPLAFHRGEAGSLVTVEAGHDLEGLAIRWGEP